MSLGALVRAWLLFLESLLLHMLILIQRCLGGVVLSLDYVRQGCWLSSLCSVCAVDGMYQPAVMACVQFLLYFRMRVVCLPFLMHALCVLQPQLCLLVVCVPACKVILQLWCDVLTIATSPIPICFLHEFIT